MRILDSVQQLPSTRGPPREPTREGIKTVDGQNDAPPEEAARTRAEAKGTGLAGEETPAPPISRLKGKEKPVRGGATILSIRGHTPVAATFRWGGRGGPGPDTARNQKQY